MRASEHKEPRPKQRKKNIKIANFQRFFETKKESLAWALSISHAEKNNYRNGSHTSPKSYFTALFDELREEKRKKVRAISSQSFLSVFQCHRHLQNFFFGVYIV